MTSNKFLDPGLVHSMEILKLMYSWKFLNIQAIWSNYIWKSKVKSSWKNLFWERIALQKQQYFAREDSWESLVQQGNQISQS